MVTWEQFARLKAGDVVLLAGKPRMVLEGPSDDPQRLAPKLGGRGRKRGGRHSLYVHFAKRRNSQYDKPTTLYNWNDCKHRLVVLRATPAMRQWMCELERCIVAELGFDPAKEMQRALAESMRLAAAFGRRLNRAERLLAAKLHRSK